MAPSFMSATLLHPNTRKVPLRNHCPSARLSPDTNAHASLPTKQSPDHLDTYDLYETYMHNHGGSRAGCGDRADGCLCAHRGLCTAGPGDRPVRVPGLHDGPGALQRGGGRACPPARGRRAADGAAGATQTQPAGGAARGAAGGFGHVVGPGENPDR
ncbi:hypothetical protein Micbo1qcDRAFT_155456 [Microdochium bolleyi]|uniref:Uncharacterized protein n=1 Tax=Microdochium bolleyi TaxID=196109 RepID=A0A136JI22_9PEZI|nr:hypothetical protein Micbo1qcDRAFT_155456 [Microdochium bolleyi]